MKKIMKLMLLLVVTFAMALPIYSKADAAKVLVLPLVNATGAVNNPAPIYLKEVVNYFKYPEFELIPDTIIKAVLKEVDYKGLKSDDVNVALMTRVMHETGADIVIVTKLTDYSQKTVGTGADTDFRDLLLIKGETIALNGLTGKVEKSTIRYKDTQIWEFVNGSEWGNKELGKQFRKSFESVMN